MKRERSKQAGKTDGQNHPFNFDLSTRFFFFVVPISALGITNQRETTIVWDKITGQPLHNAIGMGGRREPRRRC